MLAVETPMPTGATSLEKPGWSASVVHSMWGTTPPDETGRLADLQALDILDTPPERRFDRLTRMAAALFDMPIVLVSLIDSERQWFKSRYGTELRETPREMALCAHAILEDRVSGVFSQQQVEASRTLFTN